MLTKKQQIFLDLILDCYKETKEFPTIGILKTKGQFKSYNSIYKYLQQLEKKEYIRLDSTKKKIIYIKETLKNEIFLQIPILNENRFLTIFNTFLKKEKDYVAFRLHDNKLNSYHLLNRDLLVIEKSYSNLNNKLILVKIKKEYKVLQYIKKDGFIHLQNDKESFFLSGFEGIVGKVCFSIRDKF